MEFCDTCDMYAYNTLDGNSQTNVCHNCKSPKISPLSGYCVLNTPIRESKHLLKHAVKQYTHLDQTLPRISIIPCPNAECLSNADGKHKVDRNIVYIRYDDKKMEYLYMCTVCEEKWNTST